MKLRSKFKSKIFLISSLIMMLVLISSLVMADGTVATWTRVYCTYNSGSGSTACDSGQVSGNVATCDVVEGTHCAEEGDIYCYVNAYCEGDPQGTTPLSSNGGPTTAYNVDWDTDETDCTCYAGINRWSIGGETALTSCCGDDSLEYRITRVAGTDSTFSSSSTDDGCCIGNTDCIYGSSCYDPGQTLGTIPDKNYCSSSGEWEGGDAGSTQCSAIVALGRWNLGGEVAATSCCGDDSGEHYTTDGVGSAACCDSASDCVDSGNVCREGVDEDTSYLCTDGVDNDCNGLKDDEEPSCYGTISGYVKDENNDALDSATVKVFKDGVLIGETYSIADGSYSVDVSYGTLDVVAFYSGYVSGTITGVTLSALGTVSNINFQLTSGITCEADCTYIGDEKLHVECDGKEGCSFYDARAIQVCDLVNKGWEVDYNETHTIECPSETPVEKERIPAVPTCAKESLVKFYRIIKYQGKTIKMVTVVCGD